MAAIRILAGSLVAAAAIFLAGCATSSSALVDPSKQYAPTENVVLLEQLPTDRPYEVIAYIDGSPGYAGQPLTEILEVMRKEAASLGAHALVPAGRDDRTSPQGLYYNPALGAYQVTGGHTFTHLRGAAIRYLDQ